ncbi:MAG: biotin--[acetyl-CoA-carboxylase] ligase [Hyphomicrobiales bacterium]|nr:MAG: biotin--[acetyl-CoA-carboxylase] ligase [Hyphomicrobiales bacterium]
MPDDPILPAGSALARFDEIDSTNSEALRRAPQEGPLWVWARVQTKGRGRQGRVWASGRGNLYASLLLPVDFEPALTPQVSFVAALAVHDTAAQLLGKGDPSDRLKLKWPNDVLLGGAKIAGILLEGASSGAARGAVAIGCGINLAHHPELDERKATSLGAYGCEVEAGAALSVLAAAMQARLGQWRGGAGFAAIRADWLARVGGLGERVEIRLPNERRSGIFATIDSGGALILRLDDGQEQRITAGDVFTLGHDRV